MSGLVVLKKCVFLKPVLQNRTFMSGLGYIAPFPGAMPRNKSAMYHPRRLGYPKQDCKISAGRDNRANPEVQGSVSGPIGGVPGGPR